MLVLPQPFLFLSALKPKRFNLSGSHENRLEAAGIEPKTSEEFDDSADH